MFSQPARFKGWLRLTNTKIFMNKQGESDRILPVTSHCFLVMEYITSFCNFPGQKVVVVACCCPVRGVHCTHVHVHVSVHTPVTVRSCSVWSEQPGSHELLLLTTGSHRAVHTCLPPPEGPQVRHTGSPDQQVARGSDVTTERG